MAESDQTAKRDQTAKYKDLLRIRIIGPEEQEWYQDGIAVPRVGEEVIVMGESGDVAWEGIVDQVSWGVPQRAGGMIAIVQLRAPDHGG